MYVPEQRAPEREPAWQVITGVRRRPRRQVPKSWLFGVGALLLSVAALYVHTVAQEAYLVGLQREIGQIKDDNTAKRSMLASMQNPRRIETVATQKLAMKEPKEVVFLPKPVVVKAAKVNPIPPPPAVVHEGF